MVLEVGIEVTSWVGGGPQRRLCLSILQLSGDYKDTYIM